jgi:uncharacterized protein involved in type VI secretion and phage assembly
MGTKRLHKICFIASLIFFCFTTGTSAQSTYCGKYRGIVVDINDSLNSGRIKVRVPAVFGDQEIWALPAFPFAGDNYGLFLLPELANPVWIEFEACNINYPVWTGSWYIGNISIPNLKTKRILITSKGHKILIDDAANTLEFAHSAGPEIIITNEGVTLKSGNTTLAVKAGGVYINNRLLQPTAPAAIPPSMILLLDK